MSQTSGTGRPEWSASLVYRIATAAARPQETSIADGGESREPKHRLASLQLWA